MIPRIRALIVLALLLTLPLPAYAYLDPQTGSMIVSALVAFVATLGMGIQAYWHQLLAFVRRVRGREHGDGGNGPVDG